MLTHSRSGRPTKWCVARYWFGPANSKAWNKLLVLRETAHPIVQWALEEELEERRVERPSLLLGVVPGPSTGAVATTCCAAYCDTWIYRDPRINYFLLEVLSFTRTEPQ